MHIGMVSNREKESFVQRFASTLNKLIIPPPAPFFVIERCAEDPRVPMWEVFLVGCA